ncbi:hypothetical protein PVK06_010680 [Gossypium arboreum]|uniref:Uncharacterized protein n=1 Tax=Gossypium arboreum TaxID=29729 RepID=A0ABR0Q7X2_GOSAR|nr:hypothetical protein PVK06_010680 [Gossypium arboreum]
MNLSTLARTSLLHLSPLRSTSSTRDNATESVAIEGHNINFSVNTRQGKMVPILKDCSIRIPSGQLWMLLGPNGCVFITHGESEPNDNMEMENEWYLEIILMVGFHL